jgi:hypothetical protein
MDERGGGVSSVMFDVTVRGHAMEEDAVVRLPRTGDSGEDDPLLEVLRSEARRMLQQAIEAALPAYWPASLRESDCPSS